MTILSSLYGIILDSAINALGNGKNVFDLLNATYKRYLRGEIKLIGKLRSNYTTKIGMFTSDSKGVSIKFADQCLHILYNKEVLNRIKVSTKIKNRESLFKYQS